MVRINLFFSLGFVPVMVIMEVVPKENRGLSEASEVMDMIRSVVLNGLTSAQKLKLEELVRQESRNYLRSLTSVKNEPAQPSAYASGFQQKPSLSALTRNVMSTCIRGNRVLELPENKFSYYPTQPVSVTTFEQMDMTDFMDPSRK
jgi:hypothetical protein